MFESIDSFTHDQLQKITRIKVHQKVSVKHTNSALQKRSSLMALLKNSCMSIFAVRRTSFIFMGIPTSFIFQTSSA